MIGVLIITMMAMAALQEDQLERQSAVIFAIPCVVGFLGGEYVPGSVYFHLCAVVDLIIIFALLRIKSKLAPTLAMCALASIILNFVGFLLWVSYQEPTVYVFLFVLYYAVIIYILAAKGSIRGYTGLDSFLYRDYCVGMGENRGGQT